MKKFYNLILTTVMLASTYLAVGQCPAITGITSGLAGNNGIDLVCDDSNIEISWTESTDPDAEGYWLKVGNNAGQIDNYFNAYIADPSPGVSTGATLSLNVPIGNGDNGTNLSYTVEYTIDPTFTVGTGASHAYVDCFANALNFKVADDPTFTGLTAAITDGEDAAGEACVNTTIEVTVTGGDLGDNGEYYYQVNAGGFISAGTSATFDIDITAAAGFNAGAGNFIEIAIADEDCGVNWPVVTAFDVIDNNGAGDNDLQVNDVAEFTSVDYDGSGGLVNNGGPTVGIAEGTEYCYDGAAADFFTLNFQGVLSGAAIPGSELELSVDSGQNFLNQGAFATGDNFTITGEDIDYAFAISGPGLCASSIPDTFFVSTINSPDLGANFTSGVTIQGSAPAATTLDGTDPAVIICGGEDGIVDVSSLSAAEVGDPSVTEFSIYDIDGATRIVGPILASTVLTTNSGIITIPNGDIVDGNSLEIRVHDCNGSGVGTFTADSEEWSFSVQAAAAAGTTSEFTIDAGAILDNDKVCPGATIDLDVVVGDATLGYNGILKLYKVVGATTTLIDSDVAAIDVDGHTHGPDPATYLAAIVNDCGDSIGVALTNTINVGVFNSSGNLTAFSFPVADSLNDNLACDAQNITLQATPTTLGDDSPVVTFYSSVDNNFVPGGDVMLGAGAFNIGTGAYELPIVYGNATVYYYAELVSTCVPSSIVGVAMPIAQHTTNVDPTDFDISTTMFNDNNANTNVDDNDIDLTEANCEGQTYWYTIADGTLAVDDESMWFFEADTGMGWFGLDTNITGQVTITVNNDNTMLRARIDGGECGYTGAWLTSNIRVVANTTAPTLTQLEEDNGGTVVITADDETCDGNDINFVFNTTTVGTDNPMISIYDVDGMADVVGPVAVAGGAQTLVLTSGLMTEGNEYELRYFTDCIMTPVAVGASHTVDYKEENANAADLTATYDAGGMGALGDPQFVCPDNGIVIRYNNAGTLGDANNFDGNPAQFTFEVSFNGGGFVLVQSSTSADFVLDVDSLIAAEAPTAITEIDVRSAIVNGCTPTGFTNEFDVNIFDATNGFATISLNNDNYCADQAGTLAVNLVASGATVGVDNFSRIVWYSIDDLGNPVTKIKETTATSAGQITEGRNLRFNTDVLLNGIVDAPDTTTTIGVRIESCDTSAFEVRTITVKDLPENNDEDGNLAVVSASPASVCSEGSSTLNIINYILGTNGQVKWYDSDMGGALLATGPSFTAIDLFNDGTANTDTTFYVRIEADCGITNWLEVDLTLSEADPTPATSMTFTPEPICEGETTTIAALGSNGSGSYVWEVSFDGVVFNAISDNTPGDMNLTYSPAPNTLNFVGGEATVTFRVSVTNGCETSTAITDNVVVRERPENITSLTASDDAVCETDAPVTLTAAGGSAGFDGEIRWYVQYNGGGYVVNNAWDNMSMVTFDWTMFSDAGTYDFRVQYESQGACAFVPVPAMETVVVTGTPMNDLASPIAAVCSNDNIDLSGLSGYTGMNQSFSFSGPGVAANVYTAANGSFVNSTSDNTESITYMVTENGCTASYTVDLTVYGTPVIDAATATPASCMATDGQIEVTSITGGTGPFEYSANDGASYGAANPITGLSGGNKQVRVRDANLCVSNAFTVNVPSSTGFSVVGSFEAVSCNDTEDGEITVTVSNGLSPYDYELYQGGMGGTLIESDANETVLTFTYDGLAPDDYYVLVTDAAGCTQDYAVTLAQPGQIGLTVANFEEIDCFGEETGVIGNLSATSTNGGPFEFSLNGGDFSTANSYTGLAAGEYIITVKDANDCTNDFLFTLDQPDQIILDTNVVTLDQDGFDVQIVVDAGGVAPFEYRLNTGVYQASNLFEDLPDGTYDFFVRDANGCEESITVLLRTPNSINEADLFANVVAHPNPFNNEIIVKGLSNGVEITMTDLTGKRVDFLASIKNDTARITTGDLTPGVYFATFELDGAFKTIRLIKE